MITPRQRVLKRSFDLLFSILGLLFLGWALLVIAAIAYFETGKNGFFKSERIGKNGKHFLMLKIRSMRVMPNPKTTVTTENDPRISHLGRFWRKTKLDELPQLWNVMKGEMSFVGPRPDVPGFADELQGEARKILLVRPGITGPASLKFNHEERVLATKEHPEIYNRKVIWPEKVRLNLAYVENYSFLKDLGYILKTLGV